LLVDFLGVDPMPDVSLKLLVLKTHHVDVLRAFYEVIGMSLCEEQHGSGPVHYSAKLGDVVLEIYPLAEGGQADTTSRIGFAVDDLGYVLETLWRRELAPITKARETEWGLRSVVRDPDGRAVELYQR